MSDVRELPPRASSKQTHYDTLGVSPTATPSEVVQAFARKMGALTPRSVADLAQLSVAYETLRDPQKRRAYDASLRPTPTPVPTSKAMPEPHYAVNWRAAPAAPSSALIDRLSRPSEECSAPAPSARVHPKPEVAPPSPRLAEATPEPDSDRLQFLPDFRNEVRPTSRADQGSIDVKRAALALAWPIMGIAILGGVAGWAATISEAPEQPEPTTKRVLLPEASKLAAADASLFSAIPDERSVESQPPKRPAAPRIKPIELPATLPAPTEVTATDPLLPEAAVEDAAKPETAAETLSETMPLSNQTIARTIGRIGYACGEVTSTAPVEGEDPGVFKVTCSSGQSYQARPVGGRYHFRRWNRG